MSLVFAKSQRNKDVVFYEGFSFNEEPTRTVVQQPFLRYRCKIRQCTARLYLSVQEKQFIKMDAHTHAPNSEKIDAELLI